MDNIALDKDHGDDSFFHTMSKLDLTLKRAPRSSSTTDTTTEDDLHHPVEEEIGPFIFSVDDDRGDLLPSPEEIRTHHAVTAEKEKWLEQHENCWKISFFVVLAGVIGIVIGIVLGFQEGEQIQKLENQANKPQEPSPSYVVVTSSPTRDPIILTNSPTNLFITSPPTPSPTRDPTRGPTPNPPPNPAPNPTPNPTPKPTNTKNIAQTILPTVTPAVVELTDPSNSHLIRVQQWLIENQFSSAYDFVKKDSYHFKAVQWIANEDYRPFSTRDKGKFIERYVIALLWFASHGNDDENEWRNDFDFMSNSSVCNWGTNIGTISRSGIICDDNDRITEIRLVSNNLRGPLITELGLLRNLEHMTLDHNSLTGSIPEQLAELTALSYLALHNNQLSGKLRTSIGALTNLAFLGLGDNEFSGAIPEEWKALKDLTTLGLGNNLLDEGLETLESLPKLQRLFIGGNRFDDNLENLAWDKMPELKEVDLSNNELVGSIPKSLIQLPILQVLSIGHNKLTGILPDLSSSSSTLRYLALSGNSLNGSIHESIGDLAQLLYLDLSNNKFTGTLPHRMKKLTQLKYLFLSHNNNFKAGGIFSFVKHLTSLRDLSLASTNRVGLIPEKINRLTNLVMFDLSSNGLSNTIPSSLGNLKKLKYLLLNRNHDLGGTVPKEIQNLPQLEVFMVDQTSVTGNLTSICNRDSKPKYRIIGANCRIADEGNNIETRMECGCCIVCCDTVDTLVQQNDKVCNNDAFFGQEDPFWENSYQRHVYNFEGQKLSDVFFNFSGAPGFGGGI